MADRMRTYNAMVDQFYERELARAGVDVGRVSDLLYKSDDPVLSSITGVYTALMGPRTFVNLDQASVLWKILPKIDFQTAKSGVKIVTAHAATAAGITETGALVETDHPDLTKYNITLKRPNYTWDVSEVAEKLSAAMDGQPGGEAAFQAQYAMDYFARALDIEMLCQNGALAGNNLESIDRMIASAAEVDNNSDSADAAYTANDVDFYTCDRDSATTTDAQVSVGTSAANRALTVNLIDEKMQAAEDYGFKAERGVLLTKGDTLADWAALLDSKQQFNDYVEVSFGVNGVESARGRGTGVRVAAYQGVPVFKSPNVVADGAGRIYGIDLDGVEIRVANPVRHVVSPISNAILHDSFVERHSLDFLGELTMLKSASHFKVRDLA